MDGKPERLEIKHLLFVATSENTRRQLRGSNTLNRYTQLWQIFISTHGHQLLFPAFQRNLQVCLFVEPMESLFYLSENIMETWMHTSNVTPQNTTVRGFEEVL